MIYNPFGLKKNGRDDGAVLSTVLLQEKAAARQSQQQQHNSMMRINKTPVDMYAINNIKNCVIAMSITISVIPAKHQH